MKPSDRRVVVTGLGTVNSTGLTVEASWANVLAGNSGIGYFDLYDAAALNVRIGGQAWGFDPAKYMDPRDARRRDRLCQLAVAATRQALEGAALRITDDNATTSAVCMAPAQVACRVSWNSFACSTRKAPAVYIRLPFRW